MVCGDTSFMSVMPSTKSTKFDSRYLVDRLSERDEILYIDRGALLYVRAKIGEILSRGPWGTKILRVSNFCNAFLVHGLSECDEIWHDEGHCA